MFLPKPYSTGYNFATRYRDYAKTHCEKPELGSAVIVELDEFWHFIESKKKRVTSLKGTSPVLGFDSLAIHIDRLRLL